jgi:hypothetical protein
MRHLTLGVVCLLLLTSSAIAQDLDQAKRAIRQAFEAEDAGRLRPVLHDGVRTYVSLPTLYPEEGHFGASQVFYIFRDVFSREQTRGFELSSSRRGGEDGDVAYLRAVWRHTSSGGSESEEEAATVIFMTLESNEKGLALTDIKETSP